MTDEQLARNLQSVGQACFVKYFEYFSSERMSAEDITERLRSETIYTEKSCISRIGHARSIIRAGLASRALKKIINSDSPKVSESTRSEAQRLLDSLNA